MTDERSVTINLPLVQSSGTSNSSTTNGNGVNSQQTPQSPTGTTAATTTSGSSTSNTAALGIGSGGITIQTALPGSSSFSVGTKSNQSIISDAPVTDPGGNSTKQVNPSQTTIKFRHLFVSIIFVTFVFLAIFMISEHETFPLKKKTKLLRSCVAISRLQSSLRSLSFAII